MAKLRVSGKFHEFAASILTVITGLANGGNPVEAYSVSSERPHEGPRICDATECSQWWTCCLRGEEQSSMIVVVMEGIATCLITQERTSACCATRAA